jgi:hypothetical protein
MRCLRSTSVSARLAGALAERHSAALHRHAAAAFLLFALAACSSDSQPEGRLPFSPDGGKTNVDSGGPPPACTGPGYAKTVTPAAFNGLSATVVDEDGDPTPNVSAQACGINLCINGKTDAYGVARITERQSLTMAAFKYGGGQKYARFALPLELPAADAIPLGEQRTVAFDPPSEGAPMEPGKSATSRGATLTLASNATIAVDPFDFDTDDLQKFRSAEVPEASWPQVVDRSLDFVLLVALTPSDAEFCPAARLTLANTLGLAPGTRVEFFLHGTDVIERWAPYGGWAKVSDGEVSADGASIETDPSGGIPVLSAVGVRLAE